jgi:hypothetical protein
MNACRLVWLAGNIAMYVSGAALAQTAGPPGSSPFDTSWIAVTGKPCFLHLPHANRDWTAEWTGACQDGYATGPGTATLRSPYAEVKTVFGTLTKGSFNGKMVIEQEDGIQHTHIEVDQAVNGWASGQGVFERDVGGAKNLEYTGQISLNLPSGYGHGITYDRDGQVQSDYTGQWKSGKPVSGNGTP